jgi:hypothetical protein
MLVIVQDLHWTIFSIIPNVRLALTTFTTTHGPHTTTQEQVRRAQPLAVRTTIPLT